QVAVFVYTFFFYCYGDHRDLHSFPTRRSSDLAFVEGPLAVQFAPRTHDKADFFEQKAFESVLSLKAETHNFPTTVEPFNGAATRSEEHTSELQSRENLVCRLLLEKKKKKKTQT